jgi:proteasome assembly chaperone (PAC2) family protein
MEPGNIIYFEQPPLRKPDLVIAFLGWPDAAQAATGAASHLISHLPAIKFAEMKPDDYYDFSTVRPIVTIENGLIRPLRMPVNGFYYWLNARGSRDIIVMTGIEPQLKWQAYVDAIADVAEFYKVNRVYAIGSLFDRIPHTRETRLSGLVNDPALTEVLELHNLEQVNYQGPSSIHGLLLNTCALRRIPAISIWGHVPFYIRSESNPVVCLETVKKMSEMCEIQIDTAEMERAAADLYATLNRLLSENEQMRSFLKALEEQYDLEGSSLNMEVAGAEHVIKDIEDFLRNQRGNDG